MARKHKHGNKKNRPAVQPSANADNLQQERLGVLLDWYLARVDYYARQGDKYAACGDEKNIERAAGKWMLFRYKAERLIASL